MVMVMIIPWPGYGGGTIKLSLLVIPLLNLYQRQHCLESENWVESESKHTKMKKCDLNVTFSSPLLLLWSKRYKDENEIESKLKM